MRCVRCHSDQSPQEARFCVACGYALRQPCPYGGCAQGEAAFEEDFDVAGLEVAALSGTAGSRQPEHRCARCGGFLQICSVCQRLHRLDERACRTHTCAASGTAPPPREVYAPCHGTFGAQGSSSTAIPTEWNIALGQRVQTLPGDWWRRDGQDAAEPTGGLVGLAFRYGRLVGVREREAVMLPLLASRQGFERRPSSRFQPLQTSSWPLAGVFSSPYALLSAHGCAYLLSARQAWRLSMHTARETFPGEPIEPLEIAASASLQPDAPFSVGEPDDWNDASGTAPGTFSASSQAASATPLAPGPDDDWESMNWDEPSGAAPSTWGAAAGGVEWRLQATTRDFWLALGAMDAGTGEPRGVAVLAPSTPGVFEGQSIGAPPLDPAHWRGLAVCGDAFVLWSERQVWAWPCPPPGAHDGAGVRGWIKLHEQPSAFGGLLPSARGLVLWGASGGRIWVREVPLRMSEAAGSSGAGSLVVSPAGAAHWVSDASSPGGEAREVYPHPVLCGSQLFFWASDSAQGRLYSFDLDNPAGRGASSDAPHVLQPGTRCVWAMGARPRPNLAPSGDAALSSTSIPALGASEPEPFLVFALQSRSQPQNVTFFALRANQTQPATRLESFDVRLDASGASLAATLAEGRLVVAAQTIADGLVGRVFDLT